MANVVNTLSSVLGGAGYDYAKALVIGSDGSFYIGGITTKSFDNQLLVGETNAFVTKFTASGNKVWTRFIGNGNTEASSITIGADGSIYLGGWTTTVTLSSDAGSDGFVSKISPDGNLIWSKNVSTAGADTVNGISALSDGSIYIAGKVSTPTPTINNSLGGEKIPSDSSTLFIQKISTEGNAQWTILNSTLNTFNNYLLTVSSLFAESNYLYVCGATDSNLYGQINSGGGSDAFISKYSSSGSLIWCKLLSSTAGDAATAITSDSNGNVYVVGNTASNSTINFEGQQNSASRGAFLTKLNSSGNVIWSRLLTGGNEVAYGVTTLSDGSVWVTGQTTGNLGASGQSNAGATDGFICKFDSNGNKIISYLLGGSNADFAFAISSNKSTNSFIVAGATDGASGGAKPGELAQFGLSDAYVMGFQDGDAAQSSTPSYRLVATSGSFNEGSVATFSLSTSNLSSGTSVPYTLSGISAADVSGGSLSGNAVVNSSGVATISISIQSDSLTEGAETLTVSAGGTSASAVVNDTSLTPIPSYSINSTREVTESGFIYINVVTANVPAGTPFTFKISGSGITPSDIWGANANGESILLNGLSGVTTANSTGVTSIYLSMKADELTEGDEIFTVSVESASSSAITIFDTSKSRTPTYSLSSSSSSFNEGSTASFTLTTSNLVSGTTVPFTLSGISAADLSDSSLSGSAVINSNGIASISVALLNDSLTEGVETLTVTAGGATASTLIYDTSKASTSPTYAVAATNSSLNEGSTATFILTTTNVPAGTSIEYLFSGISGEDVVGVIGNVLGGFATIDSNGQATISVLLKNDNLTEGPETLTVTTGATSNTYGVKASIQINDTSISPPSTYSVRTNWTTTTEGTPIVATLSTSNVVAGTTLYYKLSGVGITTSDFSGMSLTGSSVINSLGQASLTIPLLADATTEGDETFVIQYYTDSGRSITAGSAANVTILDTSKGAVTPTYAVSANSSSVNEGSTADFTITTSNVSAGSSIAYTLSGISSSDITGGALTGFATVNSSGTASLSVPIAADNLTEGTETLTISLQGKTASILINDTSKAAAVPTYNLVASVSSVNEGLVAAFNLTTTGVSPGTSVAYTISGVTTSDVTGGLSGTATVDSNGLATISVPLAADFLTEGAETLTVTAQGKSASILVNDTSKTTLVASYALSASTSSVAEGSNAVFTLTTTNVAGGTAILYTISGLSALDITGGALSGTAIVNSSGTATISIPIAADLTTEGTETLVITAQGISTSTSVLDTSLNSVTIPNAGSVTSIPYGTGQRYIPSAGADKVVGTSSLDVVQQASTYASNKLTKFPDGTWQVQNQANVFNTDTLTNIERVEFSDLTVALDIPGAAGQTAKILGAVFGPSFVSNTTFAGIGIAYLDAGASYKDLSAAAANAAGYPSNDALISALIQNTTGAAPTTIAKNVYLNMLNAGTELGDLVVSFADSTSNSQSIKLTTLATTGLLYTPFVIPSPPTYKLTAATTFVNEGQLAQVNLATTNVAAGTTLDFSITGISSSDVLETLSRQVIVDAAGRAVIDINVVADLTTEGQETMYITLGTSTTSFIINDTSITIVGVIDNGGGDGGGGGGGGGGSGE